MSLADGSERQFGAEVRRRGLAYVQHNQVDLVDWGPTQVLALVSGNAGDYVVNVDWSRLAEQEVVATCECPYFADGFACKHIWATLLEIELCGHGPMHIPAGSIKLLRKPPRPTGEIVADTPQRQHDPALLRTQSDSKPQEAFVSDPVDSTPAARRAAATGANDWLSMFRQVSPAAGGQVPTAIPLKSQIWFLLDLTTISSDGEICIDFLQVARKRDGSLGKPKSLTLKSSHDSRWIANPEYRLVERLIHAESIDAQAERLSFFDQLNSWMRRVSCVNVFKEAYGILLPEVASTGNLYWTLNADTGYEDLKPVAWDAGETWKFELLIRTDEQTQDWLIRGRLVRDNPSSQLDLDEPELVMPQGLVLFNGNLALLDSGQHEDWIRLLRSRNEIVVPPADRELFLARLLAVADLPPISWPSDFVFEEYQSTPRGSLSIDASEMVRSNSNVPVELSFEYEGRLIPADHEARSLYDPRAGRLILRDLDEERRLIDQLVQHGLEIDPWQGERCWSIADRQLLAVIEPLIKAGWQVEVEGKPVRSSKAARLTVCSGIDWFDLEGEFQFDGFTAGLPELLSAARTGSRFIRLEDGSQGVVPIEWLERFESLLGLGNHHADGIRFQRSQALVLDALLAAQEHEAKVDQGFSRFREKLKGISGVKPREPSRQFSGELRDYQKHGLGWLRFLQDFHAGGCLADDMGLGKTIQILALLESRRTRRVKRDETRRPSLIVVPKSLAFNWREEAKRFTPRLRMADYIGADRGELLGMSDQYDVLITTYGTLRRDAEILHQQKFDYVILDEAQAIKNSNSLAAKACRLLQADHRLALTGTPVENHLDELWSLFEFLNPGLLGRSKAFKRLTRQSQDDPEALQQLSRAVSPYLLRRTKEEVLKDLPQKNESTIYCELLPKQRKQYDQLRDHYREQLAKRIDERGLKRSKVHVLEALLRLRQAACHPGLLDQRQCRASSAKFEALFEQIEEVVSSGHKALIFSQFTSLLALLRDRLDEAGIVHEYLDGKTSNRKRRVERFQADSECPLFLISLKAGGHGLNLTAADYVYILDPWWSPAVEAQAVDRSHRIGQQRPVFSYRLIASDTIEDKILELQESKRTLADSVITANSNLIRDLSLEDLQLLLS